jgi:hypothetical protein
MEGESSSSSSSFSPSIFILRGATRRGMVSDQKMGNHEWTLMNANEGTERGIHAASSFVVPALRTSHGPLAVFSTRESALLTLRNGDQSSGSPSLHAMVTKNPCAGKAR